VSNFRRISMIGSLFLVFVAAPAFAEKTESKIVVVNKSAWAIHELYFSPTNQTEWGEDQLGKKTIKTGEQFTLTGVPCGKWDVKVVDEDGDECVVEDVALCGVTDNWVIDDKSLLSCQAKS